ncbi:hypothetical protein FYK55_07695 [Roseiconus nitratireducens]|uniref:Uncharacterized protein n=1 Tax=Roseiconus nitratireducens TaxID=2605748 RepID=A0A5M6DD69_9BACT|nr:YdjY domain-containing protein [Roseiconus nitratireducens]KAA5545517.1 hypothetical protein FYK55_07695 [Roseiconus nitratireducens]
MSLTRLVLLFSLSFWLLGSTGCNRSQTDQTASSVAEPAAADKTAGDSPEETSPDSTQATAAAPSATASEGSDETRQNEPTEKPQPSPGDSTAGNVPPADNAASDDTGDQTPGSKPLPMQDSAAAGDSEIASAGEPDAEPEPELPEDLARRAFEAPPGAKSLTPSGRLWIDAKQKRVYVDGYVTLRRGPIEMFACPVGTKEHESIVAALARSREVHAALLAIGATPGTPVRFRPEYSPPTGQVIRVWVGWYDDQGEFQCVDARQWIQDVEREKAMEAQWVFAGSGFWEDPEDHREYYRADSGDMICVSNFSSAMLDVAISSSADADLLRFAPMEDQIPPRETPVRLILVPVPNPSDDPDAEADPGRMERPTKDILPRASTVSSEKPEQPAS